jgi:3-oxoacyl-[acyl-carrier-protein] synthase-3
MKSRIVGTGSYLPIRVVTNEEVGRSVGMDAEAVYRRTGIRTRRWASEAEVTSHLAEIAARRACEAAGVKLCSVDAILLSTTSPDMVFPSTACHLQRRLDIKGAAAFDLAASCSGFLYGLSMADRMIRSGCYRRCLVVAAEIKSRFLNRHDESTVILFGDGAGAAVVEGDRNDEPSAGILGVRLAADGWRHDLIRIAAGGSRQPATLQTIEAHQHALAMRGGPLFRIAVKRLASAAAELLKECGTGADEPAHAIFHQANGRLLAALSRRLRFAPDKVYSVVERFGNTSSASLPIALDYAAREGRLRTGDLVLLGTFGGGLTWATGLVRW